MKFNVHNFEAFVSEIATFLENDEKIGWKISWVYFLSLS